MVECIRCDHCAEEFAPEELAVLSPPIGSGELICARCVEIMICRAIAELPRELTRVSAAYRRSWCNSPARSGCRPPCLVVTSKGFLFCLACLNLMAMLAMAVWSFWMAVEVATAIIVPRGSGLAWRPLIEDPLAVHQAHFGRPRDERGTAIFVNRHLQQQTIFAVPRTNSHSS